MLIVRFFQRSLLAMISEKFMPLRQRAKRRNTGYVMLRAQMGWLAYLWSKGRLYQTMIRRTVCAVYT